jgi:mono/diheme cytochrome c family protein
MGAGIGCTTLRAAPAGDAGWAAHIEPLFKEHCAECHNPTKTKSGLDLSSLQSILKGGERGAAVLPGRPEESNLYRFLTTGADPHMPPGKRKPLDDEQVALIRHWIEQLPVAGTPTVSMSSNAPALAPPSTRADLPVPSRAAWKPRAGTSPTAAVDGFLEQDWKKAKVKPAPRASDAAFVRRVYLDLIGRIPSPEERDAFAQSKARDKRGQCVDALLRGQEYPRRMRELFDAVLMGRSVQPGPEQTRAQWQSFLEDAFRENRPWNEFVRELIVARPEKPADRGAVWYLYERRNNAQAMAEAVAPVVFGVQIKCAQCHDHMVAREIKQAHYWGTVAAFNRSKNIDTAAGPGVAESAIGGFTSFANLKKETQPAFLTFFNGRQVEEAWPKAGEKELDSPGLYLVPPSAAKERPQQAAVPRFSRRAAFAEAVTQDNPLLARALVNRIWAMLFGRGLVHPVELMDSKHPPSHPELLDWLAGDFASHGYDVQRLISALCRTRAYQLESRQPGLAKAHSQMGSQDTFSRAMDKPLTAEPLFRSLLVATGHRPGSVGKLGEVSEEALQKTFVTQFPDIFPAEYNATLAQAMFLSNSSLFDLLLAPRPDNLAARLCAMAAPESRVREAFVAVFGRAAEADELAECLAYLAPRPREAGVKQLLWAMLSSAEFQVNH